MGRFGLLFLLTFLMSFAMVFAGCGGGGGGGTPSDTYTVGGTVSGLTGSGLVLENNGGDDLTIPSGATSFAFDTELADGKPYAVTVKTQPPGQTCAVSSDGTGTVSGANVTDVTVTCSSGCNIVYVEDDITAFTTWTGDNVYVVRAWNFDVSDTLVIEPGTVVKFHPTDGPGMTLSGSGTIIADGTAAEPIVFTSYKDDAHGCDANGDGSATTPQRRDWGDISLGYLNGSVFNYVEFYYGGNSTYSATLDTFGRATVTNSVFAHNDGSDSSGWYGALDASEAIAGTVIQKNVFYDNVRPLSVNTAYDIDDWNVFHNPAVPSETNDYNGIFVETIDEVTSDIFWEETEVAYVIDDNDWYVESGATLTLGNDVVLKFMPDSVLVLDEGASSLVNEDGPGVYFTSYKDDTHKGDTNGDGSSTTPATGDWGGIYDNSLSIPYPHYFEWANILYDDIH